MDVWLVVRYSQDSWQVRGIFRCLKTAQEAVEQEKIAQEAKRAPRVISVSGGKRVPSGSSRRSALFSWSGNTACADSSLRDLLGDARGQTRHANASRVRSSPRAWRSARVRCCSANAPKLLSVLGVVVRIQFRPVHQFSVLLEALGKAG